jgi:hypothetical protein
MGWGEALVIDRRAIHIKAEINYAAAFIFPLPMEAISLK